MKWEEFGGGGLRGEGKVLQMLESCMGDGYGPPGTAVPAARSGGRGEGLVASDRGALSNVENLCGLSGDRSVSGLGLEVDREVGVSLWAGSGPQVLA